MKPETTQTTTAKSIKSHASSLLIAPFVENEVENFFESYLNTSLKKFNVPLMVTVRKKKSESTPAKKSAKYLKHHGNSSEVNFSVSPNTDIERNDAHVFDSETIIVDNLDINLNFDNMHKLMEFEILNYKNLVPRVLMQLINLVLPYFKVLTKFTIKRCHIDDYVIYEINKTLSLSSVTEVCLDDSCVEKLNCFILLDDNKLQNFSLSRCKITDEICDQIFKRLEGFASGAKSLVVLNLSSNRITDKSAKQIHKALRTNRVLRYLNLSDNQLTDDGVYCILQPLKTFLLENEEIIARSHRRLEYLTYRISVCNKNLNVLSNPDPSPNFKRIPKRTKSQSSIRKKSVPSPKSPKIEDDNVDQLGIFGKRANTVMMDLVGPFEDPYKFDNIIKEGEQYFCVGNLTLCYLNLAYNNLSYLSLLKIYEVLAYQEVLTKHDNNSGLVVLNVDGNNLPEECSQLMAVNGLLAKKRKSFACSIDKKSALSELRKVSTK